MGFRARIVFSLAAGVFGVSVLMSACSSPKTGATTTHAAAAPGTPALWGDMKPVVSVKELMRDMIDPIADNIFDSVAIIVDKKGTKEYMPKTDEDWEKIRVGGTTIAEGVYLLKVARPFTPPGEENNSTGPDAVELSSAAITDKVRKDPVEWNARIEALRNVGLEVLDTVKKKNIQELWDASDNLDNACEACHKSYWYPGETPEYYARLDRRLREYADRFPSAPALAKPGRVTKPLGMPNSPR
jgi:cytochrome c556